MTKPTRTSLALAALLVVAGCGATGASETTDQTTGEKGEAMAEHRYEVVKSEEEWRRELTPEEFEVLRKKGTERAFTGDLLEVHEDGVYVCAACGQALFASETKFDSGTGWPSFYQPIDEDAVATETDRAWGMRRTEVLCSRCGGHLGHVFDDGPRPTGLRYCMNSVSMDFEPAAEGGEGGER
jgi:peptide-methionine (R)-S-oxide reductase